MVDEVLKNKRGVPKGTIRSPYATKKIETVTINFRVPKSCSEACKDYLRPLLKDFLTHFKQKVK
jgi:hypothetical protein